MNMMKRNEKKRKMKSKRIVAAGIVSLTVVLTASAGISYADMDIAGAMASWFNKKTEQVIQGLDQSMKSETDAQKEMLKKELQLRLEASTRSLESFTDTQKQLHLQALEQHAQSLLAATDVKTEQDRIQVLNKLQAILDSAKGAMDTLAASYVPPAMVFMQSPPVILVSPPPIAPPVLPPVTQPVMPPAVPPVTMPELPPAVPPTAPPPTVISDVYVQQADASVSHVTYNQS
jgi:predicted regulator of Ras-like GTPase activity (Roadblock/LC7/MglB family)